MTEQDNGRPGGLSSDDGAASVSALRASIPDAALALEARLSKHCKTLWSVLRQRHIPQYADIEPLAWANIVLADAQNLVTVLHAEYIAQGMETGTAKTEGLGAKHDSPVPKGCAQPPSDNPDQ